MATRLVGLLIMFSRFKDIKLSFKAKMTLANDRTNEYGKVVLIILLVGYILEELRLQGKAEIKIKNWFHTIKYLMEGSAYAGGFIGS